jgi:hypothetical protein
MGATEGSIPAAATHHAEGAWEYQRPVIPTRRDVVVQGRRAEIQRYRDTEIHRPQRYSRAEYEYL